MVNDGCPICGHAGVPRLQAPSPRAGGVVFEFSCPDCGCFRFVWETLQQNSVVITYTENQAALRKAILKNAEKGLEPLLFDDLLLDETLEVF